ncbi:MAG: DegT/DnrJ/EryC1/StrS family aminotransferase [Candidatus Lokiarchaeota archaeon]|nr:DegT/DnrJ/EryC1/StrS family aminotransferase [Candidatus Lokiarchaeota archaeon]
MRTTFPLFDIYWDEKDVQKVSDVIRRGSYWAVGPEIREFETRLEKYFDIEHIVTFNSGTSALHASLLAHDIINGEVIVPSMSFISTANCAILAGARPVFAEIEEDTLGLDLEDIKEKITNKTKAIIPMHYGGKVCKNINELREIADDHDLILIEDNAESFGAKYKNKFAGTFGHSSILSFCQNKIIPTGEGGAVCTNDKRINEKLLLIRSHGRVEQPGENYFTTTKEMEYIEIGYNFRMPTICAALGLSQLEKIDKLIELRRAKGKYYDHILKNVKNVMIIPELQDMYCVYQLYSIFLNEPTRRDELQQFLIENNIYTKVYFHPIHLKKFYRNKYNYKNNDLPKTERISKKLLTLPFSPNFTENEQKFIVDKILEFFKE